MSWSLKRRRVLQEHLGGEWRPSRGDSVSTDREVGPAPGEGEVGGMGARGRETMAGEAQGQA